MTDTEIIKALECYNVETDCKRCPLYKEHSTHCIDIACKNALDLIIRQQTELENLKVELQSMRGAANSLKMHYEEAQAKIDKLKECPKCVYEYDGEIMEYCVQGPCSNFKTVEQVKAEVYKECLAKVKNYIKTHCNPYGKPDFDYYTSIKILNFIDNLAKEMVGENND